MYSSLQRPYGSIDGLIAEVPATEGYADARLFGSLSDSQVTAHIRAMSDPSGGPFGRDVHRSYMCFNSGDCNSYVGRQRWGTSSSLLVGA
jgi:hypothetical protein